MSSENHLKHPFGEESCEAEIKILQSNYEKYYFEETPFNAQSLDEDTYLIVGRRGTGKTSLSHYFSFQKKIPNTKYIDVDEPKVYSKILSEVSKLSAKDKETAIPRVVKIWEYMFWTLIFSKYKDTCPEIKAACISTESRGSYFIKSVLRHILTKFLPADADYLSEELEIFLSSKVVESAKKKMLEITKDQPVILAVDTEEKYSSENEEVMMYLAALVECSSNFNVAYSDKGIHIKTFVSAEIFPYLTETEISNTVKYVRNPVYMHWRPKDLMRLACWRFYSYLKTHEKLDNISKSVKDWSDYEEVMEKIWTPYFGEKITNGTGMSEKTFTYVLRHTQMRPRQIVVLCNAIAKQAVKEHYFPHFYTKTSSLVDIIKENEINLANGVINVYSSVYPNVNRILDALSGTVNIFKGSHLDSIAYKTKSEWQMDDYSPTRFKQILAELGIVGVVRTWNKEAHIIEADFEYALKDRLVITSDDECVLHPMFFEKFRAKVAENAIIYPFPDHPDYSTIHD